MIKTLPKIICSLVLLNLYSLSIAQGVDSLSVINAKYDSILHTDENSMEILFYKQDKDVLINNLGPFGSPSYHPSTLIVSSKDLLVKQDLLTQKLYSLSGFKPYTNITYINASRREQQFVIRHVQSLGESFQFDFYFKKMSSPGAFLNQEANNTLFKVNLKYESKKKNYDVKFSTNIERSFYQENGGLFNVKNYESKLFDDDQNYLVNLNTSNSFNKKHTYSVDQRLNLFQINKDSISKRYVYFKHRISYSTTQKVFNDNEPMASIYNDIFLDTLATVDSIYTDNISNTGFFGFTNDNYVIDLFGQYDLKRYEQSFGIKADYHNTYIGVLVKHINKELLINGIAKIAIDGYRKGDIESEVLFCWDETNYKLTGRLNYYLNEPSLKLLNYTSNHFKWTNTSFKKQSIAGANISFKLRKIDLDFELESKLLNNTFYFDTLAIANQNIKSSSITSFSLGKNYKVLNFYFRSVLKYQITSDEILFPLPEFLARQIVYYQKYIFKKVLKVQFGVGISYSSDYFGYAYMPAINEFYVQGKTKIGEYPQFDLFINTQLKRAQIFLKYEHINAGSNLNKAYTVPGYPLLNKSLKFGVSWNMFD
ncbi:MAG: hypothetical protein QNK84_02650 [Flavobacteriales bacterium]